MKFFIVLLLSVAGSCHLYAQNSISYGLNNRDGLVNNSVYSIIQDKKGFMWFGSWKGLSSYDTRGFKTYRNSTQNSSSLSSNYITASFCDSRGSLWFGTTLGLNRYNASKDSFERFYWDKSDPNTLGANVIWCFDEDKAGNLWVGTSNGITRITVKNDIVSIKRYLYPDDSTKAGFTITSIYASPDGIIWAIGSSELIRLDPRKERSSYRTIPLLDAKKQMVSIYAIHGDKKGTIWIGSKEMGLSKFDPHSEQFFSYQHHLILKDYGIGRLVIEQIVSSANGDLWLRTNAGLLNFNPNTTKLTKYALSRTQTGDSGDQEITKLYVDKQNCVWVGTLADGVKFLTPQSNIFTPIARTTQKRAIQQILMDASEQVWLQSYGSDKLGNRNSTWFLFNEKSATMTQQFVANGDCTRSYFASDGSLWLGLINNILVKYDVKNGKLIERDRYALPPTSTYYRDQITSFTEDKNGLVVGTLNSGLYFFDKKNNRFLPYDIGYKHLNRHIAVLFSDKDSNLWIGSSFGLTMVNSNKTKITRLQTASVVQESFSTRTVNSIHQDNKGRVWVILSNDGLYFFDVTKNKLIPKNQSKDIYGQNIHNLQHDNAGNLWLSNELGLVEYNTESNTTRQFFYEEGIPGTRFMANSAVKKKDGAIFFGTNNGAFYFYPDKISFNHQPPALAFTDLRLFNKLVSIGDNTQILSSSLSESREITLKYNQSNFSIDFAVLNFIYPEKNKYAYKLEGFEKNWNEVKVPTATYTNLPPGTYNLLIKGANNDGIWSKDSKKLTINVLSPWWNSWYSWIVYIILSAAVAYYVTRFLWQRRVFKQETELQEVKLNFFTNISHEIRTRLMLITGPVEQLLASEKIAGSDLKLLTYVNNSSESLLNLVNELMDFRKMESGQTRLNVRKYDVVPFLKQILAVFEHLAISRNIYTEFSSPSDSIYLWFDSEQFQKVIYNILSNAYKFTNEGDDVYVSLEETDKNVVIEIADSGKGIAPEYLDKLFQNYFQVDESKGQNTGYGIGLALSKAIVENMNGTLEVTSKQANGNKKGLTVFRIELLKGKEHYAPRLIAAEIVDKKANEDILSLSSASDNQYLKRETILFAEDNDELRAFISDSLNWRYNIISVRNGKEAWEICTAEPPDLIISDVMMSEMDGLELCQKIRSDIRTSHIPIILLTAKTAVPNQVEGLKHGADLYVAKPISMNVLELNIKNLLDSRKLLQQRYSRHISLSDRIIDMERDKDDEFLNRIVKFIEDNIEDKSIGVPEICQYIGMSKTILYQKLRALTDLTVNDFIKLVRFKLAARLLKDDRLNIQEVAFRVGYDNRKHFSREFKKYFGKNPSEYVGEK